MSENCNLSNGSADGFVSDEDSTTEDTYSLYTGLRKPWLEVFWQPFKNKVWPFLLTNVTVSIVVILSVVGLSLGLGLHAFFQHEPRPTIDFSLEAFSIPNHEVTRHQDALDIAVQEQKTSFIRSHRSRRSVANTEKVRTYALLPVQNYRLPSSHGLEEVIFQRHKRYARPRTQYRRRQRIVLVYLAVGGKDSNIFTRERIETIHRVEADIVGMPEFSKFCFKSSAQRCEGLNSLVSRFFYRPSTSTGVY